MALVLPILLMIFAGIIDFGFMFQRYEVVTNAAREGARMGTLPGYSQTDIQNRVENYLDHERANGHAPNTDSYIWDCDCGHRHD